MQQRIVCRLVRKVRLQLHPLLLLRLLHSKRAAWQSEGLLHTCGRPILHHLSASQSLLAAVETQQLLSRHPCSGHQRGCPKKSSAVQTAVCTCKCEPSVVTGSPAPFAAVLCIQSQPQTAPFRLRLPGGIPLCIPRQRPGVQLRVLPRLEAPSQTVVSWASSSHRRLRLALPALSKPTPKLEPLPRRAHHCRCCNKRPRTPQAARTQLLSFASEPPGSA